jgi:adenylosuccinate lyase
MEKNIHLTKGLVFSQTVLHALIDKNLSRDEAYDIVQPIAMTAQSEDKPFKTLLKNNEKIKAYLDDAAIDACFDYQGALKQVDCLFKRVGIE